tara:strand:- start:823 stop:2058 length:1236 start_codon:yes stop_codon:yes gene_type:complete
MGVLLKSTNSVSWFSINFKSLPQVGESSTKVFNQFLNQSEIVTVYNTPGNNSSNISDGWKVFNNLNYLIHVKPYSNPVFTSNHAFTVSRCNTTNNEIVSWSTDCQELYSQNSTRSEPVNNNSSQYQSVAGDNGGFYSECNPIGETEDGSTPVYLPTIHPGTGQALFPETCLGTIPFNGEEGTPVYWDALGETVITDKKYNEMKAEGFQKFIHYRGMGTVEEDMDYIMSDYGFLDAQSAKNYPNKHLLSKPIGYPQPDPRSGDSYWRLRKVFFTTRFQKKLWEEGFKERSKQIFGNRMPSYGPVKVKNHSHVNGGKFGTGLASPMDWYNFKKQNGDNPIHPGEVLRDLVPLAIDAWRTMCDEDYEIDNLRVHGHLDGKLSNSSHQSLAQCKAMANSYEPIEEEDGLTGHSAF